MQLILLYFFPFAAISFSFSMTVPYLVVAYLFGPEFPSLLGGSSTLMIGKTIWNEFFQNRDWPVASAVAIVLLMVLIIPIVLFQRQQARNREAM